MSVDTLQHEIDANQARASDPRGSAWVSANAGTGKTTVLVRRVLRLLLHKDAQTGRFPHPESILCLTYTKAAAGEMEKRLFETLAEWAMLDDDKLAAGLARELDGVPDAAQTERARQLFAKTLDTQGGLKIYTIHAFCERLLHRFPLEAAVPSGFQVLEDVDRQAMLGEAVDAVLSRATAPDNPLSGPLNEIIASAGEATFREIVDRVLSERERLRAIIRVHDGPDFAQAESTALASLLAVPQGADEAALAQEMSEVLSEAELDGITTALETGIKTDLETAQALREALKASSPERRAEALEARFLTQGGGLRKQLMTKAVREAHPDLADRLAAVHGRFYELAVARAGLRIATASGALLTLADAIFDEYERRKQARAALDYDDLIEKTGSLLTGAAAAAWVLYKLDYGIAHILVDEAQDTSPAQWRVIDALTDEFFAGEAAHEGARTVFAVGDEKQSIYSFQGADPAQFSEQGKSFAKRAEDADAAWDRVPLTVSFRSAPAILQSVDAVFEGGEAVEGLSFDGEAVVHQAIREGQVGLVEIWSTIAPPPREDADAFAPHRERQADKAPADALARRIAGTIRRWLDDGTKLESRARAIRPGDIVILVPRRGPFTRAMIRELKARSIPVAGADRMRFTEQLAVMDLMALGDFLLMTEDDLALASVLKSPLFGFDDDDLFAIGWQRRGSLWRALQDKAKENGKYRKAAERLAEYLDRADYRPPYEFFAELLEENRMAMRHALIARLGADAGDALDEFLNLGLRFETDQPPSLQAFLDHLRAGEREVKRDMEQGRDEVRVMTVYGAKGLEAEIVFLPDTCAIPRGRGGATVLDVPRAAAPPGAPDHLVWVPSGTVELEPIADAKERRKHAELCEYHRLLYVAMTRARDRLYVCGWETQRARDSGCWYDLVFDGLKSLVQEAVDEAGETVWRYASGDAERIQKPGRETTRRPEPRPWPDWALRDAPREVPRLLPLAPSAIAGPETGAPAADEQGILSPDKLADQSRFLRGNLLHALLEHLPALDADAWEETAARFVAARGADLDERARAEIVGETLRVLRHPDFAPLFGPGSLAEVPIAARIERESDLGLPLDLAGQIDRLVVLDDAVLIVDYKTNRPPPDRPEDVAPAYVRQLAAYRCALRGLFPEKQVRAALLWTDGPDLMEIPASALDEAEEVIRGVASP